MKQKYQPSCHALIEMLNMGMLCTVCVCSVMMVGDTVLVYIVIHALAQAEVSVLSHCVTFQCLYSHLILI
jgi:hypothetical protein